MVALKEARNINRNWLKAQSFSERLEALRSNNLATRKLNRKCVRIRSRAWLSISAFKKNSGLFEKKLKTLGCSRREFECILGIDPFDLFPSDFCPDWLEDIFRAESRFGFCSVTSESIQKYWNRGLISPFISIINYYYESLYKKIAVSLNKNNCNFDPSVMSEALIGSFLPYFEQNVRRAVVLEINCMRMLGQLDGDLPSQRYQSFIAKCLDSNFRLSFLSRFPVLARYAQVALSHWMSASESFVNHLAADWKDISDVFDIKEEDSVCDLSLSGDTHNQGKSVITVKLLSGVKLVYKPRNLDLDVAFQKFILWYNDKASICDLGTIKIINRSDHGWAEFIPNEDPCTEEQVELFYSRLGSLIAIAYAFKTVDIHFENLVAFGASPIIVDLETLFHPDVIPREARSAVEAVEEQVRSSVMSIGILPTPVNSANGTQTFDISAIGASVNQQAPYKVTGVDNFGRDDVRITHIPGWIPSAHNSPSTKIPDSVRAERIVAGFSATYEFLRKNKHYLTCENEIISDLLVSRRRIIVRDTKRYGSLQTDEFHPDLLRDSLDRAWHWDSLWNEVLDRPSLENFINSELQQVERYDIPHFTAEVGVSECYGSDGSKIDIGAVQSGWSAAENIIKNLDASDCDLQVWFIRASLGQPAYLRSSVGSLSHNESHLTNAIRIGDEIVSKLVTFRNQASLLTVNSLAGENSATSNGFSIGVADHSIYDGTAGIALFLGYLGHVAGERRFTDSAKALLCSMIDSRQSHVIRPQISAFKGIGSDIYALSHLAALWNDSEILGLAEGHCSAILKMLDKDWESDLLLGSAGCLLAVAALHSVSKSRKSLQVIAKCADHLISNDEFGKPRWNNLTVSRGLSHGLAGVALALFVAHEFIRSDDYLCASLEAIKLEDKLIAEGQWTDTHKINGRCQLSWCHGAPGIAIGRLKMYRTGPRDLIRPSLEAALEETRNFYSMNSNCLCHGTLGNLEALHVASEFPEFGRYTSNLDYFLEQEVHGIERNGWRSLLPNQTLSFGLMTGLSGIGFSLLRFSDLNSVPSVLQLAQPMSGIEVSKIRSFFNFRH
jgi:type 2 lantibiotic biosynthesis protein LanM